MLSTGEKAYCAALLALKRKDYGLAAEQFEKAAPFFADNKEFNLYRETTRLLVKVKNELSRMEREDVIEVEEIFSDG